MNVQGPVRVELGTGPDDVEVPLFLAIQWRCRPRDEEAKHLELQGRMPGSALLKQQHISGFYFLKT